jgi:hypothetical protein
MHPRCLPGRAGIAAATRRRSCLRWRLCRRWSFGRRTLRRTGRSRKLRRVRSCVYGRRPVRLRAVRPRRRVWNHRLPGPSELLRCAHRGLPGRLPDRLGVRGGSALRPLAPRVRPGSVRLRGCRVPRGSLLRLALGRVRRRLPVRGRLRDRRLVPRRRLRPSASAVSRLGLLGGTYCDEYRFICTPGCGPDAPCPGGGMCKANQTTCSAAPVATNCFITGCPAGTWCDGVSEQCETGCDGTADCPSGSYCDTQTHGCLPAPVPCPANGCPPNTYCDGTVCQPGCQSLDDCTIGECTPEGLCAPPPLDCAFTGCPPGDTCSPETLRCVPACSAGSCETGAVCDADSGWCVAVAADCTAQGCPAGEACDPGDGLCKPSCSGAAPCDGGQACDVANGVCVTGCSPQNCAPGNHCNDQGVCVPGCITGTYPCPAGEACNEAIHACVSAMPPGCDTNCAFSVGLGNYCSAATGGMCVPGCDRSVGCGAGPCDLATHSCFREDVCGIEGESECSGICTDLRWDNRNCGACGVSCESDAPTCGDGVCTTCPDYVGVASCSGSCVNILSDPQNCGSCGNACNLPEAVEPYCVSGACVVDGCWQPFADCDHQPANGCETNTDSDVNNCGSCGHVCPDCDGGPACHGGTCSCP